jgi:hypothetical protein
MPLDSSLVTLVRPVRSSCFLRGPPPPRLACRYPLTVRPSHSMSAPNYDCLPSSTPPSYLRLPSLILPRGPTLPPLPGLSFVGPPPPLSASATSVFFPLQAPQSPSYQTYSPAPPSTLITLPPPRTPSSLPVAFPSCSVAAAFPSDPLRVPRTSVVQACKPCQKAHGTCSVQRPCKRCISRDMQDDCVDEVKLPFHFRLVVTHLARFAATKAA